MRIAYDTNLLVYADAGDRLPQDADKWLIVLKRVSQSIENGDELFAPAQVFVELHDVLTRKRGLSKQEAGRRIKEWQVNFATLATSEAVLASAIALSATHQYRIFDAIILAAAADARCDQLLSEDLQHGFVWRGVEVVNPFI